ncbi:M48 family metallopeptidase [Acaryochloris marina]|uniref:M48 family metallopeptidase n=1 Tax=Acaryochloris marina TaxID=155978 RepID=UPI001BAF0BE7|nr:M48 family metallopeptidase [Acaryochloris marina]QUY44611.1 M48 family metallopeptidase [Acaryochloris marina S15]
MQRWFQWISFRKISTPEEFDALVYRVETMAQRNPSFYRSRLRLLACLGYIYILAVFVLLFAGLWGIRLYLTAIQDQDMIESLNYVTILVGFSLLRLFFVRFDRPKGIPMTRKQVPELFAMLDELALAMKAPKLNNVILNGKLNAAIVQRPRFGLIGWQSNYLLIGLPLLQALSPQQCKAVLAHELAHLCGDDGRASAWIYRIRRMWYDLAERFEHSSGGFLFDRFFRWYGPFFRAFSFVHARAQEYEADRRAAGIVGAHHQAEALIWLYVYDHLLLKEYWSTHYRRTLHQSEPDDDSISQILQVLRSGMSLDQYRRWLALCLAQQTTNASTHPCLSERLERLAYSPVELLPPKLNATVLLGDTFPDLTAQLNQFQKQEETEEWVDDHDYSQHQLAGLHRLNQRPEHLLTLEEQMKRASTTWQLQDRQQALSMFQSIIVENPHQANARYWVGYLLTEEGQADGVTHLEYAMDHDPSLVTSACRQLYGYYHQRQQPDLAEPYKRRWQQHQKAWKMALTERSQFAQNTQFKPHGLPEAEIRQLTEHFSSYPEIKTVYLVQRVLERFPECPYYIFGMTRRPFNRKEHEYFSNHKLKGVINVAIAFSSDYALYFHDELVHWDRLKRLPGAKIYPQSWS